MKRLLALTKRYCEEIGLRPSKKLGQSFLIDEVVLNRIIEYAEVEPSDEVLEIGPGFGFLTELLAKRAKRVFCIEKDRRISKFLHKRLGELDNVVIIEGDFLKVDPPKVDKVVSNPPYSIASPLLFKVLDMNVKLAVLTLQREFAQRMIAKPGTRSFGRLTVSVSLRADVELLEYVPSSCFFPRPKVDSVVVRLFPKKSPPEALCPGFNRMLITLFSQRRKKVSRALGLLVREGSFELRNIQELSSLLEKRVYQLAPAEFVLIYSALKKGGLITNVDR